MMVAPRVIDVAGFGIAAAKAVPLELVPAVLRARNRG